MNTESFLDYLRTREDYRGQIVRVETIAERQAVYRDVANGVLSPRVLSALRTAGVERFYSHQAEAIAHLSARRSVVVVSGTASGKTLCYLAPTADAVVKDRLATALFIYPTKALAQDQLRSLDRIARAEPGMGLAAGVYDGDTPQNERRRLRETANVILTNPDMLHQGILPQHQRWNRFLSRLTFVVLDEVHSYRGVFGSHLANVIRRLRRICRLHGSDPLFVCCSATIGNPLEHAQAITGADLQLVDDDGSPCGAKSFVLWNPPLLAGSPGENAASAGGERRSPLWEAVDLMSHLIVCGIQTIAFARTRLMAELIVRHVRERLHDVSPQLARTVEAYRGGYLPEERRDVERRLADGSVMGVASTNALELGIDIGTLDASILVGYPGTIASTRQQAGRAGRKGDHSLVFLIGGNTPIDQYLMANPEYLFKKNPEQAVIDPDNPHIALGHLKCALYEMPLRGTETSLFGEYADALLDLLENDGQVRKIDDCYYWACDEFPAAGTALRNLSGPVYTIQDIADRNRIIGIADEATALCQLHDHAVYLHGSETYLVESLDIQEKTVLVTPRDLDYYTQSVQNSRIRIEEVEEQHSWRGCTLALGEVTVTTTIPMFKKIRFHSRDSLGWEQLDLPPQRLETVALWLIVPDHAVESVRAMNMTVAEGLAGIANALVECAPLYIMCDVQDIGAIVDSSNLGMETLFVYDRYPGGMGYALRCARSIEDLMGTAYNVISSCACSGGCPSCVGSAVPAFALSDADSGVRGRIPDKHCALAILDMIFGSDSKNLKAIEGTEATRRVL